MAAASPFLSNDFRFEASHTWAILFKRRHKIKQRKITKFVSKRDIATLDETIEAQKFQRQIKLLISNFNFDLVINTDQISCQYQTTYSRSLDFQGAITVLVKNKV